MIVKYLKKIFKKISYFIFIKIYGAINSSIKSTDDERIETNTISINEEKLSYKVYQITNGRLYTDRIHDTAVILDDKIIEGPSFQLRQKTDYSIFNSKVTDNIVFSKGTPRKLINLNGSVLSLLTGGAGNNNYWHWLYDVLPRFGLCSRVINLKEIDYFLLPDLLKKFQKESLDCLNIPISKRISSEKYRHIKGKKIIMTDHPVVTTGDATKDIQNIPIWIVKWLRDNFLTSVNKQKKIRIFIDRGDNISGEPLPQRLISNNDEVKKYLSENNFIPVQLQSLDFKEQVELFNNAECVVGLHGSGFGNIAFCQPNTKIIEIKSLTAGDVIGNLAKKINLNYKSIDLKAKEIYKFNFPNQQGSVVVPINILSKVLEN